MIKGLLSRYSWRYPSALVYMLQSCEYQIGPYLRWYWHTISFTRVANRRTLDHTKAAHLLLMALRIGMCIEIIIGLMCIVEQQTLLGVIIILIYPIVWAHVVTLPLIIGRELIVKPRHQRQIDESAQIFARHPGIHIAVAGSYGKTSMKELLLTVLSEGKKVAATPANKNVAIAHAQFARKLTGDEDILIIEYGEGAPGDVKRLARTTHPTHAVITGVAPAHLDQYKTVEAAGRDIFSVADAISDPHHVYVNAESGPARPFIQKAFESYTAEGALGWKVSNSTLSIEGISFTMKKEKKSLSLQSGLIGRHQVGPLVFVAALAHELGLTDQQITRGIAKTKPFEHRMQPYTLAGAWIIDDTYNGNIEGIRVGTQLLKELPGKRKVYITPGLVDQGAETIAVHKEMGELIAAAHPDVVVLMNHSVTPYIKEGLKNSGYQGEVLVEDDPLSFYTNMQLFVAAGDLIVMQNDWTDNYA